MSTPRTASLLLASVGVLVLVFELLHAPAESLAAAATFAVIWVVRQRLLRKPHHQHGYHWARREILTTAVIAGIIVALASLALTTLDLTGENQALPLSAASDDQLPWTAGLLLNGVLTLAALAWALVGSRGLQRRPRHHQEETV